MIVEYLSAILYVAAKSGRVGGEVLRLCSRRDMIHERVQAQQKEMDNNDEDDITPTCFTDLRNYFQHGGYLGVNGTGSLTAWLECASFRWPIPFLLCCRAAEIEPPVVSTYSNGDVLLLIKFRKGKTQSRRAGGELTICILKNRNRQRLDD